MLLIQYWIFEILLFTAYFWLNPFKLINLATSIRIFIDTFLTNFWLNDKIIMEFIAGS